MLISDKRKQFAAKLQFSEIANVLGAASLKVTVEPIDSSMLINNPLYSNTAREIVYPSAAFGIRVMRNIANPPRHTVLDMGKNKKRMLADK